MNLNFRPKSYSNLSQFHKTRRHALPTPEESAAALTDYMAKAHTEKLRAVADATVASNARIEELEAELESLKAQLEAKGDATSTPVVADASVAATSSSGITSVDLPFTNKAMGQKLDAYRTFTAKYLVKAQQDKYTAVQGEKRKWVDYYTALMEDGMGKDFQ